MKKPADEATIQALRGDVALEQRLHAHLKHSELVSSLHRAGRKSR